MFSFFRIKKNLSTSIVLFILFYALFALQRIKSIGNFSIDGRNFTNEVLIYSFLLIFIFIFNKKNLSVFNFSFLVLFFLVTFINSSLRLVSLYDYFLAICIFFVPVGFIKVKFNSNRLIVPIIFFVFIYSLLAIISVLNYNFLLELVGIQSSYIGQVRGSFMLGSSITVSYYLLISIPILFFLFNIQKKYKSFITITILLTIIAIILLLSRLASIVLIFILSIYLVFNNKIKFSIKASFIMLIALFSLTILSRYDISRLFMGFNDSSVSERFKSIVNSFIMFSSNPFFGSGIGRFYLRFNDESILYNNLYLLPDPHNFYVFLLSEVGLIGLAILSGLIFKLIHSIYFLKDKQVKFTFIIIAIVILLVSMGGSQIYNEMSFSVVFWIYLSFLLNFKA
jgi:O-antigen ligase